MLYQAVSSPNETGANCAIDARGIDLLRLVTEGASLRNSGFYWREEGESDACMSKTFRAKSWVDYITNTWRRFPENLLLRHQIIPGLTKISRSGHVTGAFID